MYRQVGSDAKAEGSIRQITYVVDQEATSRLRENKNLEPFREDVGFIKEIEQRAANLGASKPGTPMRRLNQKYFEYFDALMKISENSVQSPDAKRALLGAQATIADLIDRLQNLPETDPNWTQEEIADLMSRFSAADEVEKFLTEKL